MADVTTVFAARDESFAKTVSALQDRLGNFGGAINGFNERVGAMANGLRSLVGPLVGIGAAVLGAKSAMDSFKSAIDLGGRLEDLSKRTNMAAGDLAILERTFRLNGVSADALGPAMDRLNRFIEAAGSGASSQTATLQRLGITYQQLATLTPLGQMQLFAERIGAIGDPALRTAMAVDVFGKAGGQLVPIFRDFGSATEQAKAQLGSLPDILNQTSANIDSMGDALDAMSTKFDEFTLGVIAGVNATANFGQALANIDAAGFGQGIGQSLRVAFEQPLLTSKIIGQTLLVGAKEAGNNLINAALTAGNAWVQTVGSANYAEGIGLRIRAGLLEALNAFNKVLASSIKTLLLEPFASLPGIVGDPFRMALASVKNIQATLDATSQANYALWTQGGELIKQSLQDAANNTQVLTTDWLGVAASANQAAQYIQQASDYAASTMVPAMQQAVAAAQQIDVSMHSSAVFSEQIKFSLNEAALSAASIVAPAFSLAADKSAQIALDLNNTSTHASAASNWLGAANNSSQGISLNGSNFEASAMSAAAAIGGARVDAQITSDLFKGLSERMNSAVNSTSSMLDKMREAFHFGQMSEKEITDYNRMENRAMNAETRRDRAYERAQDMEARGHESAARRERQRADAEYTKTLEKLQPQLKEGAEKAQQSLKEGGADAAKSITKAAEAFKDAVSGASSQLALEKTLQACRNFLSSIDKKLPQHALVP